MKNTFNIRNGTYRCNCDLCNHFNKSGIHYWVDVVKNNKRDYWENYHHYNLFFTKYVIDKGLTRIILFLYITKKLLGHESCPLMSFLMNNE